MRKEKEDGDAGKYHITMIHAEGDSDIPFLHTQVLFWHAVNATTSKGLSYEELELLKESKKTRLGPG